MSRKRIEQAMVDKFRSLLTDMVQGIVDHPEAVKVNVVEGAVRLTAELHTHRDDVGQVVGKGGRVAQSIRTILAAFGGRHQFQADMDYVTEAEKDAAEGRPRAARDRY